MSARGKTQVNTTRSFPIPGRGVRVQRCFARKRETRSKHAQEKKTIDRHIPRGQRIRPLSEGCIGSDGPMVRISGTALIVYETPSSERYDGGLGDIAIDLRLSACGDVGVNA